MRNERLGRFGLLVLLAALLLYGRTLPYPFVFDDHILVEKSPTVAEGVSGLPAVLERPFAARGGLSAEEGGDLVDPGYRPLRTASYALDVSLYRMRPGELEPWGFRLTNILLHLLVAWLVARVGRYAAGRHAGVIAAALFALHPLATESVIYVSGRKDLLAAAGYLGALLVFLRYRSRPAPMPLARRVAYGASMALLFALALGAKEMAVTLPLACLVLDVAIAGPRSAARRPALYVVLFAMAAAFAALILGVTEPGALPEAPIEPIAPWVLPRVATMARIVWLYIGLFLWPARQSADYSFDAFPGSEGLLAPWTGALALAGLAALGWASLRLWRRGARLEVAHLAFFFIALLPVIQIVPHPEPVAERYLYLPLAGLCLLAGRGVVHLAQGGRRPALAGALIVALLGAVFARTWVRAEVWSSEEALFADAAAAYPRCARANVAYAEELTAKSAREGAAGRIEEASKTRRAALDPLDRALEVLPDEAWDTRRGALRARALFARAAIRADLGLYEPALRDLEVLAGMPAVGAATEDERAARLRHVLLNRAAVLRQKGDADAAEAAYGRVLALGAGGGAASPAVEDLEREARVQVADLAYRRGDKDRALAVLAPLGEERPGAPNERGQRLLAAIRIAERDLAPARALLERMRETAREDEAADREARAAYELARVADLEARLGDAARLLREAITLDPDLAAARFSLADNLLVQGKLVEALEVLRGLARIAPRDPRLLDKITQVGIRLAATDAPAPGPEPSPGPTETRTPRERAERLYESARRAWDARRPDAALAALEAAVAIDADFGPAQALLGRILLATGRPRDAATRLRRAASLSPDDLPSRLALVEALLESGEADATADALAEASEGVRRARALQPPVPIALVRALGLQARASRAAGADERAAALEAEADRVAAEEVRALREALAGALGRFAFDEAARALRAEDALRETLGR